MEQGNWNAMMKAETGDHDIGPTGCDDESQGKGKSLRPRSIPFNFRHLNELANVGIVLH